MAPLSFAAVAALALAIGARGTPIRKRSAPSFVFAHFMLGNTGSYTSADDYTTEIQAAQAAGIDGFALNIGNEDTDDTQLGYVYQAADAAGFKLFISFDFTAHDFSSDWSTTVVPRLTTYAADGAAATLNGGSIVSTFAGDGFDWGQVKSSVGTTLEVIPFYAADALSGVNVDGGFQWNSWPSQDNQPIDANMTTDGDSQYQSAITADGLSVYMAGVSPWFFTHYGPDSFNKNWLYLSDTLLVDRLNEMSTVQPQLIEVITWNDFGESSYIGPLHPDNTAVYPPNGASPGAIDWVTNMPHDAWRDILKVYIASFKDDYSDVSGHIDTEEIVYWYRPTSKSTQCSDSIGAPTGSDYPQDAVFAATLLTSEATLSINGATFDAQPGITYFAGPFGTGAPSFELTRSGSTVMSGTGGLEISDSCTVYNFNAYVGSITAS